MHNRPTPRFPHGVSFLNAGSGRAHHSGRGNRPALD